MYIIICRGNVLRVRKGGIHNGSDVPRVIVLDRHFCRDVLSWPHVYDFLNFLWPNGIFLIAWLLKINGANVHLYFWSVLNDLLRRIYVLDNIYDGSRDGRVKTKKRWNPIAFLFCYRKSGSIHMFSQAICTFFCWIITWKEALIPSSVMSERIARLRRLCSENGLGSWCATK